MATDRELSYVRQVMGPGATLAEVAGDASTRRFFRARLGGVTAILMAHEGVLTADAPLFSNHRILSTIGAPVPAILGRDEGLGLVLVEDFGDLTLQKAMAVPAGGASARVLYLQACDLLALFQRQGTGAIQPGDFAARNSLDKERFLFELDHFHRHFIAGLGGLRPAEGEESLLRRFYEDLATTCDRLPRVYCHRDFQSRNLMVVADGLRIIDFQDARMGPYTYDAASLLRDSSLDLPEDLVLEMLEHLAGAIALPLGIGREEFRRDFDVMALQRNIKDLGTFGYMATVRGARNYLDFVPRTQASIRRALLSDRQWHDVYGTLDRYALGWDPRRK